MRRTRVCIACKLEKRDYCFSKWFHECKPCRSRRECKRQQQPHVKELRHLWRKHRYANDETYRLKRRAEAKARYWYLKTCIERATSEGL